MAGMTTKRLLVCAGAAGLLAAGGAARGAVLDWVGTAGPLFFDMADNWNPAQVPTGADTLRFSANIGANNPIIVGASSASGEMAFTDNAWELTGAAGGTLSNGGSLLVDDDAASALLDGARVLASNNLAWNNSGDAIIGSSGYGTLLLDSGADIGVSRMFVGFSQDGTGEVTLAGAGTTLTATLASNQGVHTIGRAGGTGTLNVLDGAHLRTTSAGGNDIWVGGHSDDNLAQPLGVSTGTLNVDGVGSFAETEDLNVGIFGGVGFLNITNGGQVVNTDGGTNGSPDTAFGANDGFGGTKAQGFGVVDGDGSLLRSRSISVGGTGTGTLDVRNGGEARTLTQGTSVGDLYLGNADGSQGKAAVHGTATDGTTNSLMDVGNTLFVGNIGLGVLNIGRDMSDNEVGSGSLQVDLDLIVAASAGNSFDNKVVVSGIDASANIGRNLDVGSAGTGSFAALNGATVFVGGGVSAGLLSAAEGTILVDGAGTTFEADSVFIGNGTGVGSTGQMTVSGGAVATFTRAINSATDAITLGDDDEGVGTLTVTGNGSRVQTTNASGGWFIGGSNNEPGGTGTANILAGGHGVSAARAVLGYGTGAVGHLNVDGAGSVFDANGDYILIGFNGVGNASVTGGGTVNANRIFVADAAGSAGSQLDIDGAGSVVNIDRLLYVGDTNRGTLNVINGGRLNVAVGVPTERLIIGDEGGADGSRLSVIGTGSRVDYFGTADIAVGNAGGSTTDRAVLEVASGGVFSAVQRDAGNNIVTQARIIVGDIDGGNGHVIVDGPGSRVEAGVMYVGDGNTGSTGLLDVTAGGVVDLTGEFQAGSNGNGDGTVTIAGTGSRLLVGSTLSLGDDAPGNGDATGTLNLNAGGYVANAGQAYIGHFTGSFGTANVGGGGGASVWDVGGELTLAGTETSSQTSGSGTLNVNTGGTVNVASNLRIRDLGDVNLTGGELSVGGDLILTDAGSTINFAFGTLRFTDPAGVTLGPNQLETILALGGGTRPTLFSNMHLAVDGAAVIGGPLRINGGTLSVGSMTNFSFGNIDFDAGTLNLTDSDLVVNAAGPFGADLVIAAGQALNVDQTVSVSTGATLTVVGGFSAGTLAVLGDVVIVNSQASPKPIDADIVTAGAATMTVIGDVLFTGSVSGVSRFFGPGNALFAGTFAPGASPARINFDGGAGFTPTGTLEIELGGTTPGSEHDQLVIAGDASLGGHIELIPADAHVPVFGNTYTVLTSAGLNGSRFGTVGGVSLGGGLGLAVTYTATDVVVTAARRGDTNLDGDVDNSDLQAAIANFTGPNGSGKTWSLGDNTGDGAVSNSDLQNAIAGFTGPNPAPVPEPGSLVTLAGLLVLTRRRRC